MKISVVGLGKLGAPWAAVLASKGHTVVGVDTNKAFVDAVHHGKAPVSETGLDELITASLGNLFALTNLDQAIEHTEVTFIIVPTPSEPEGGFSLRYVLAAVESLATALKEKTGYHLVVLVSTVMPGDTGTQVRPTLEKIAGKRCGEEFGLCYNPGFVALGSVIHNMLHPDFILIGESDPRAGELLAQIHRSVCCDQPRIARMNFVNAEITKLAVNTFVTMKISYANMLSRICERLAGADADIIASTLGLDSRIGPKYLKGAVSYGGPCFPRDNAAFAALGARLGVGTQLAEATDQVNREQVERLAELVLANLPSGGTVGVLGLSYKPNTGVCEASVGLCLASLLRKSGIPVIAYDPAAMDEARRVLGPSVSYATSAAACAKQADVLVVSVAWSEFSMLTREDLRRPKSKPTVIDCWRILDRGELESVANIIELGVGPASVECQAQ
ncbi:MAG TPA: nucleotide sugar dehydrogenase [Gemmataceae bacterium]|nr:nucleotide sugar dehydrogenase [Gemmataceae bacterium]